MAISNYDGIESNYAHKCPVCNRRWTHESCDGRGSRSVKDNLCGDHGGWIPVTYQDEFDRYVEEVQNAK